MAFRPRDGRSDPGPEQDPTRYDGARFERLHGGLDVHDVRLEACVFDNCSAHGGTARRIELVDCTVWSCSLHDVILEDCVLENLKTSYGRGGRTMPFFLWGVMTRRVTIRGTVGGVIWNPPSSRTGYAEPPALRAAERFYEAVDDWALDVSEARFRSVPSFRFGPPGRLIRRDRQTQPLLTRTRAEMLLRSSAIDIGNWSVVLEDFVASPWPDEIVLVPGLGGRRQTYENDLAALDRMRNANAFEE